MTADTDDERLLIDAAKADPARFAELYDRHVDRVYAYVSRRIGNRSVAEDVTATVFAQALTNLRGFEWRDATTPLAAPKSVAVALLSMAARVAALHSAAQPR